MTIRAIDLLVQLSLPATARITGSSELNAGCTRHHRFGAAKYMICRGKVSKAAQAHVECDLHVAQMRV